MSTVMMFTGGRHYYSSEEEQGQTHKPQTQGESEKKAAETTEHAESKDEAQKDPTRSEAAPAGDKKAAADAPTAPASASLSFGARLAGAASAAYSTVSHAASVGVDSAKALAHRLDSVDLLIKQHNECRDQIAAIKRTRAPGSRMKLFEGFADTLCVHMQIEEELFFPEVKAAHAKSEGFYGHMVHEHDQMKKLMADLLSLDPLDAKFDHLFDELAHEVDHHHDDEESSLFPQVRRLLDDVERRNLGERMHARQRELERAGDARKTFLAAFGALRG